MPPIPEYQIYKPIKRIIKQYPEFARLYEYTDPIRPRSAGYEAISSRIRSGVSFANPLGLIDSLRRSKTTIADIVICNKFDMFATFTFNGSDENKKKYDYRSTTHRQNPDECKHKISVWLHNQKRIHGPFSYLIVPEFHKDGKSLHFHALLYGYKGKVIPRSNANGTQMSHKGTKIFRIKSYKLGHSDLKHIPQTSTDLLKISKYIRKYITKDMPQFAGKKRYWCSTGLDRPIKTQNPNIHPSQIFDFVEPYTFKNLTITTAQGTIKLLTKEKTPHGQPR